MSIIEEALSFFNLGMNALDDNNYDEAINNFTKSIEIFEKFDKDTLNTYILNYGNAYNNRGNAYFGLKEYEKAILDYSKAIEIDSNEAVDYYICRGHAYSNLEDYEKAIIDYSKAILIEPNYVESYNNRGVAYRNIG